MQKKILSLFTAAIGLLSAYTVMGQSPFKKPVLPATGISTSNAKITPAQDADITDKQVDNEDGMLEAMKQEVAETKDPVLGYVPRQRLFNAQQKLNQQKATRNGGLASKITWTERGPNNQGGRTRAIMIDPNDNTHQSVFAASVGGGLWKTTQINAANPAWKPINDTFANLAIVTMCYDSAHPKTMYFGTGEGWYNSDAIQGDGIFKSTDGGNTWKQLAATNGNTDFQFIQKMVVDPKTSYVYAGTQTGLFRSKDSGITWHAVLNNTLGSAANFVCDITIGADDSMYVAFGQVFYGTADGIYKSFSGDSSTWVKKNTATNGFPTSNFQRIALACAPSNASIIYAMVQDATTYPYYGVKGIYKSTDGGNTWSSLTLPTDDDPYITTDISRRQAWYDLVITVNPLYSNIVIVGGVDLFRSVNGGSSWLQLSHWQGAYGHQYVHSDQHAIVYVPGQGDTLYFGTDGGIFQSYNRGSNIHTKDSNYRVTQFYSCDINPIAGSNQMLAGAQDNGNHRFSQPGLNPKDSVVGGDGMLVHIDQANPRYQFASNTNCIFYTSTDTGKTFTLAIRDGNGLFTNPTDYSSMDTAFYGCYGYGTYMYWLNPRSGNTYYSNYISLIPSNYATAVTASQTIHSRIYLGTNNGKVIMVDSALTTSPIFTDITGSSMPIGTIKCIAIDPQNAKHLIATYSNYGVNSVWETTDNGTNWTSVEGNLPDMPVRWALFDPNHSYRALLATELGVWATDTLNGATTVWNAANNGIANVEVQMLKWRASDNLVVAATHGRGLYSTTYFSNAPCSFVHQTINDTIASGNTITINHKTYNTAGTFNDTLYHAATHCDSVILVINIAVSSGVNNIASAEARFNISPNPSNGQFNIDINTPNHTAKAYIQIVNMLGQVVSETVTGNSNGKVHININNSQLAEGVYLVKLQIGTQVLTTHIVIQH